MICSWMNWIFSKMIHHYTSFFWGDCLWYFYFINPQLKEKNWFFWMVCWWFSGCCSGETPMHFFIFATEQWKQVLTIIFLFHMQFSYPICFQFLKTKDKSTMHCLCRKLHPIALTFQQHCWLKYDCFHFFRADCEHWLC